MKKVEHRNEFITQRLRAMLLRQGFSTDGFTAEAMFDPKTREAVTKQARNQFTVTIAAREQFSKSGPKETGVILAVGARSTWIYAVGNNQKGNLRLNAMVNSNDLERIQQAIDDVLGNRAATVPLKRFGVSHYRLLAKLVKQCLKKRNDTITFSKTWIRTNPARHRHLSGRNSDWWNGNGTQLRGCEAFKLDSQLTDAILAGVLLPEHDGWDVLYDMEAAGLLQIVSLEKNRIQMLKRGYETLNAVSEARLGENSASGEALDFA